MCRHVYNGVALVQTSERHSTDVSPSLTNVCDSHLHLKKCLIANSLIALSGALSRRYVNLPVGDSLRRITVTSRSLLRSVQLTYYPSANLTQLSIKNIRVTDPAYHAVDSELETLFG